MSERGVSDLMGYVLVFSLVATTVGVVSVAGLNSLDTAREVEQVNNAERALDVLADNMEDLFREGAPSRASEVTLEEASFATTGDATINVTGFNASNELAFAVEIETKVLVWESQGGRDTELRYEFGTVIRNQRAGGNVIREAPFEFGEHRTILPIIRIRSRYPQSMGGGKIRVRGIRNRPYTSFSGDTSDFTELTMNVTTVAPEIWQGYLEDREQVDDCSIVDDTVSCDFVTDELYVIHQPVRVDLER